MSLILCLLAAAFIIGTAKPLNAETGKPYAASYERNRLFVLEKIIVTAKRAPVGLSEVAGDATVVTEDEIKTFPARNLGEVLKFIPGVYIDPNKGFGRPTSISTQGANPRDVRVMIDGIHLNSLSSGQVDPSQYPIGNIKRIEVIKGTGSALWGSGLGGIINIVTKDTGDALIPKGSITTSLARFKTKKVSSDLSGKAANVGYYIFSSFMHSNGKDERSEVSERKIFGKVSCDLKDSGKLVSSFGYSRADEVESGERPDPSDKWINNPYRCRYSKTSWVQDYDSGALNIDFKYFWQFLGENRYSDMGVEAFSSVTEYKDKVYQLSLNSILYPRERDLLVMGIDLDWATLKSSALSHAKSMNLQAPYINYTLKIGPLDSILGVRYDRNSVYGRDVSPSAGIVYHFEEIPGTLLKANVAHTFNAPPLIWKYYEDVWFSVNPDLEAERAWVYEGIFETGLFPNCRGKVSLYRADVSDAIANSLVGAKYQKTNFQRFRRQGIEGRIKLDLFEGLTLFGSAAFNDVEDRVTKQTVKDAGSPEQSLDIGAQYKNKYGFSLYVDGYYNRWNKTWTTYQPNTRKFIVDLKISQKIKDTTCFLNIYNLTNAEYWADYYYPIPKRYFEGGIALEW